MARPLGAWGASFCALRKYLPVVARCANRRRAGRGGSFCERVNANEQSKSEIQSEQIIDDECRQPKCENAKRVHRARLHKVHVREDAQVGFAQGSKKEELQCRSPVVVCLRTREEALPGAADAAVSVCRGLTGLRNGQRARRVFHVHD